MKIAGIAVIWASLGASIALAMGGADRAHAMSANGAAAATMAEEPLPVEPAQYAWGGRPYCWYFEGWRGPGWYRCGNPWRRGHGWGGGHGWRGWDVPGRHGEPYGRRREWGDNERQREWGNGEHQRDWDDRGRRGGREWRDGDLGRRGERQGVEAGGEGNWRGRDRGRGDDGWGR